MNAFSLSLRALRRGQRRTLPGVFLLLCLTALCLDAGLLLQTSERRAVSERMEAVGYGDFTSWVSNEPDTLIEEIRSIPGVAFAQGQPLIYADYSANGYFSDDEGELLPAGSAPYRLIGENGKPLGETGLFPEAGGVLVSPAMLSTMEIGIGDTIRFELARTGGGFDLTVAGFFEDPFMGSAMIDRKSFLVHPADFERAMEIVRSSAEGDRLGQSGSMIHVSGDGSADERALFRQVMSETALPLYAEFSYAKESTLSSMLLLARVLSGFLLAFSATLASAALALTSHALLSGLEAETEDFAALGAMGMDGGRLRGSVLCLWGGCASAALLFGGILSYPLAALLIRSLMTSVGLLAPLCVPWREMLFFGAVLLLFIALVLLRATRKLTSVSPLGMKKPDETGVHTPLSWKSLPFSIALRETASAPARYVGLVLIAFLLTLFLSIVGRMSDWLGPRGEGLMNAFSVAEHDLGVQWFSDDVPMDEIERAIAWYSPIRKTYELAMRPVQADGISCTANVLNDTSFFHFLRGEVCGGDEVLITDVMAAELGVGIGDSVTVAGEGRRETYTVSGIYLCANGMGSNIGMSLAGYSKIGNTNAFVWCRHYILENGGVRDYAMRYLQTHYRGIDVHTNSWSGLDGIVRAMRLLIAGIAAVSAAVSLIAVASVSSRMLRAESERFAVYRSLGMTPGTLRLSFALRFLVAAGFGSVFGGIVAYFFADAWIGMVFRRIGIGAFRVTGGFIGTLLPFASVPAAFFLFAVLLSHSAGKKSVSRLFGDADQIS